jgi:hypothetical protein
MGGGSQTLLTIGALMLLSVLALSVNRAIVNHQTSALQTQAMLAAFAEARNILEEIGTKSFDEATAPKQDADRGPGKRKGPPPGKGPKDFTPPGLLKKELGESYPHFNDIDDFNGLKKKGWNPVFGDVDVGVEVNYVTPSEAKEISMISTTAKRVDVHVHTQGMEDTLIVRRVF